MEHYSLEQKRFETERTFRVALSYMGWVKLVTTSLAAFLGVLFVLDIRQVGLENSSQLFGWMCILTVSSILCGFFVLATEPFFLAILSDPYDGVKFDKNLDRIIRWICILSGIWLLLLLSTFAIIVILLINRYLN